MAYLKALYENHVALLMTSLVKSLFNRITKSENYIILPLDYIVLLKMVETKEVFELHDKIIVATTKMMEVPLITKDSFLRDLKTITTIW